MLLCSFNVMGNKKRATCFATLLQNELNSDFALLTTHEKNPYYLICCKTGSNAGGKTRSIVIQLVLQQCCRTSCTLFVDRFTVVYRACGGKGQDPPRF